MTGSRRLCLAVDVVGYGRRSVPEQHRVQQRLRHVLDGAWAGLAPDRQPNGDGEVALAPAGADESAVLTHVLHRLDAGLRDPNPGDPDPGPDPVRLRVAAHAGHAEPGANGFVGHAVVRTARLVGAPALRDALTACPATRLALLVSDSLFEDVVSRDRGLPAGAFTAVDVHDPAKGFAGRAYLHVPDLAPLPSPPPVAGPEPRFTVQVGAGGQVGTVLQVAHWHGGITLALPQRPALPEAP